MSTSGEAGNAAQKRNGSKIGRRTDSVVRAIIGPYAAAAALVLGSTSGMAQNAPADQSASSSDSNQIQEVVVTATKHAERLNDVPVSIAAMDQQTMDANGVKNIADIAALTPGVDFGTAYYSNGSQTTITIRGISDSLDTAPTAGVYIDDTPVQARNNQNSMFGSPYPQVFDLDRVEVLRGPQGTLFGAGSEAGTLRFITPSPSLTTQSGYARLELADTADGTPTYEAGAAVGGPIVDGTLGYRVSAWFRRDGGFVDRRSDATGYLDPNSNWDNNAAFKGALALAPTDWLRITPSLYYQGTHVADTSAYWVGLSRPSEGYLVDGDVIPSPSSDRFYLPSLKVEADLPWSKIESISSYFYRSGSSSYDGTEFESFVYAGVPYPSQILPGEVSTQGNSQTQNILTQEVRFSSNGSPGDRFSWVTGLYFSNARQHDVTLVSDPLLAALVQDSYGVPIDAIFGTGLVDNIYSLVSSDMSDEKQEAVYAHVEAKLTQKLTLAVGVRYAHTELDYNEQDSGPAYGGAHAFSGTQTGNPVTPQASLRYQFQPGDMVYATASKGYRLGGVNGPVQASATCTAALATLGLSAPPPSYDSDTLWNYEVGSKGTFFNNHLGIDFSAFHDDWNKIQQFVALPACAYLGFTSNLGKATSNGFDLAVDGRLGEGFSVQIGVGYTDAKYTQTTGSGTSIVASDGDHLAGSTPWMLTLTPEYRFTLSGGKEVYLRAQDQYHSHQAGPTPGTDPNSVSYDPAIPLVPSTNLLNLRAGLSWSGVDASVFINNVLNSSPSLRLEHPSLGDPLYTNVTFRPLTGGVTVTYHY
jgi:outer membrane receptor protein involved in Fe transport